MKALKITLWYVLAVLVGIAAWLVVTWKNFLDTPLILSDKPVDYVLERGSSIKDLADDLYQSGVIARPDFLIALTYYRGAEKKIKAGEYNFQPGTKPEQLLTQIVNGEVVYRHFTIVEGWTFKQLLTALNNNAYIKHELNGSNAILNSSYLSFLSTKPEGMFLPATYPFTAGTTDVTILKKAYQNLTKQMTHAWQNRAPGLPYQSPYDALIAASLVEKETARPEERPLIAGVLQRRLQQNMPLQIDSTVIYGLGDSYMGKISLNDLRTDTAYNTYTRRGLPPTPIAMPSMASVIAVLHPDNSNFIYFVAKGDGTHVFSASLQAQNQAVTLYQLETSYPKVGRKNQKFVCTTPWYSSVELKKIFALRC